MVLPLVAPRTPLGEEEEVIYPAPVAWLAKYILYTLHTYLLDGNGQDLRFPGGEEVQCERAMKVRS